MGRYKTLFWFGLAVLILVALWAFPALQKYLGEDVDGPAQAQAGTEESFAFDGAATLSLIDFNGNLNVVKAEGEEAQKTISIIATKKAKGADMNQATAELGKVAVEFKKTKEGIEIRSQTGGGWLKKPSASKHVDFRIVAPQGTGLRIVNGRGSITAKGVQGEVNLQGPALVADLNDIRGRVSIQTDKGDVRVQNTQGEARVETKEGAVTLSKVAGAVLVASGSKDITIKDGGAEADLKATSAGGSITIDRSRGKTVAIETKGGQVSITDTTAGDSLTAKAQNGSLTFTRVNADRFQAATEAGDLDLTDVQGSFDLKTQRGGVTIWRATAKGLKVSGTTDAAFFGELPSEGDSSIQVKAGSITVYIDKESAFKLDAKTGSGKVAIDQSLQLDTSDKPGSSHIRGTANGGTALLTLDTGAGDIKISTGGPPPYFTPGGTR